MSLLAGTLGDWFKSFQNKVTLVRLLQANCALPSSHWLAVFLDGWVGRFEGGGAVGGKVGGWGILKVSELGVGGDEGVWQISVAMVLA